MSDKTQLGIELHKEKYGSRRRETSMSLLYLTKAPEYHISHVPDVLGYLPSPIYCPITRRVLEEYTTIM